MTTDNKNLSIYSLSEKLKQLLDYIEENDGEMPPWLDDEFSELTEKQIPQKLQGVSVILTKLQHEEEYFKEEKRMLEDKIKQFQDAQDKLKERVQLLLHTLGENTVRTNRGSFYIRHNESVNIEDVEKLPVDLYSWHKKPVSKTDIKEYLNKYGNIDGVKIDKTKTVVFRKPNSQ